MTLTAVTLAGEVICPATEVLAGRLPVNASLPPGLRKQTLLCYPCLQAMGFDVSSFATVVAQLSEELIKPLIVLAVTGAIVKYADGKKGLRLPGFRHLPHSGGCADTKKEQENHTILVGLFSRTLSYLYEQSNPREIILVETEAYLGADSLGQGVARIPDLLVKRVVDDEQELVEAAEFQLSKISLDDIYARTSDLAQSVKRVTWFLYRSAFANSIDELNEKLATITAEVEVRVYLFWVKQGELFYSVVDGPSGGGGGVKRGPPQLAILDKGCARRGPERGSDRPRRTKLGNLSIAAPKFVGPDDDSRPLAVTDAPPDKEFVQLSIQGIDVPVTPKGATKPVRYPRRNARIPDAEQLTIAL